MTEDALLPDKPPVTGADLIAWGHRPGPAFPALLARANPFLHSPRTPQTLKQKAWFPADSDEGGDYWDALQAIRRWTNANHNALHQAVVEALRSDPAARFWNEHNFVFRRGDQFYHGKGATPAWDGYAEDVGGLTLIPLNMAEPVLVVRGPDAPQALGFAPHGAGRNFSRTEHRRRRGGASPEQMQAAETQGLDIRFHAGRVDASELPYSYKSATAVMGQMRDSALADMVDCIDPYGRIMAGELAPPWAEKGGGASRTFAVPPAPPIHAPIGHGQIRVVAPRGGAQPCWRLRAASAIAASAPPSSRPVAGRGTGGRSRTEKLAMSSAEFEASSIVQNSVKGRPSRRKPDRVSV